jgi:serine/threonine protein kinase
MSLTLPVADSQQPPSPTVRVGEVVSGKFRIERILGEGGMGVVVEATHLQLDERVALKFLLRSALGQKDLVSRFSQEARATAKLKSEYAARVIDVGAREDGAPYIVMEYLEGSDLGAMLTKSGPLPVQDVVEFIVQACEAVAEAHARGIVHRDLKPENLFCVERDDGRRFVKVLDFGISKANLTGRTTDVDLKSHDTTTLMGSPFYMSPEQLRSTKTVDHRADIWSLGATMFELLSGTTAFPQEKQFTELVAEILESPHRRLKVHCPHAPEGLEQIIDRCLEKDRERRYKTAAELAIALLPFAPRRARPAAERAAALMRAAGLTDPNLKLPPSQFPAADEGAVSGVMSAVRSHELVSHPPSNPATPVPAKSASGRSPGGGSSAALSHDFVATERSKGSKAPLLALGALLLVVGVAAAFFFLRSRERVTADPVAAPPTEHVVGAPVFNAPATASAAPTPTAPSPTETITASTAPAETTASVKSGAVAHPPQVPAKPSTRAAKPVASASTPAPTAAPDLEIRRER